MNVSIDATQFKLMDNELGDVHVETHLRLTGDLHRPRLEGDLRMDQARLELDQILLQFASPYSEQALPDVVTAEDATTDPDQATHRPTAQAMANGRQLNQEKRGALNATAPRTAGIGATGALAPLALNVHVVVPDNMVVRGQDLRPGGPTAMQVGSVNATLGADLRIRKAAGPPDSDPRHRVDGSRVLRVPGTAVRAGPRRTPAVPGAPRDQSDPRRQRHAADSEHRRHRDDPPDRHAARARAEPLQRSAARSSPTSSRSSCSTGA